MSRTNMTKLSLVLILSLLAGVMATTIITTTNGRSAYVTYTNCVGCLCEYVYVDAYEYNSNFSVYAGHYIYDSCAYTWSYDYLYQFLPSANGFTVHAHGAHLNISGLTSNGGQTVSASLTWSSPDISSVCQCRYLQFSGPVTYRVSSRSAWFESPVNGTITFGPTTYTLNGNLGYVSSYGTKNITIIT